MEDRRRDYGTSPATGGEPHSAAAETGSSARRRGGSKRKAGGLSSSSSYSTPAKRITREKNPGSNSQIHSGPLTRARQGPGSIGHGASGSSPSSAANVKVEGKPPPVSQEVLEKEAERKAIEEWEALEASIEAEFEGLRSRSPNTHVVPNHCGWFSWTKIHALEERALSSFFDGKSPNRNPEMYMEIRNYILKKFHANPSVPVEVKHLSEIELGDLDARQEVLEFLDYWGLINFHPFPPAGSAMVDNNNDETAQKESMVEKLYRFETPEWCHPIAQKNNMATPTVVSGLFSDSTIAEELVKPEGPAVEYHCNSCSADCSRKRFHCQKQADFDLCTECYNDGKFWSGMSASDFIVMEPAELHSVGGGSWTDQETLLLLEALELYKENWNEIAEHVATKTKAQCILHFVQMPIEDSFLDCEIDDDTNNVTVNSDASVPKDIPEVTENRTSPEENKSETSSGEASKPEDSGTPKDEKKSAKEDAKDTKVEGEMVKPEAAGDEKLTGSADENVALKALNDAFEALGYVSTPENPLSFADVGNPVMALAGYLARLAGFDVGTASARSSLKSLQYDSPRMQLALKQCFILEDPPDHQETPTGSQSVATETRTSDAPKDDNDGKEVNEEKNNDEVGTKEKLESTREPATESDHKESASPELPKDRESNELVKKGDVPKPSNEEDVEKETDSPLAVKSAEPEKEKLVGDPSESTKESKNKNEVSKSPTDKEETQHQVKSIENEEMSEHQEKDGNNENDAADEKDGENVDKIKRAAVSALSAAAVKAKCLADFEEEQIRRLSVFLIEKQVHKLETKLSYFNEFENLTMRVREQLDRSRQRLYHERANIIAARLGIPPSSSRVPPPMPPNRIPMNMGELAPRGPTSMPPLRPPLARPMGTFPQNPRVGPFGSAPQPGQPYR